MRLNGNEGTVFSFNFFPFGRNAPQRAGEGEIPTCISLSGADLPHLVLDQAQVIGIHLNFKCNLMLLHLDSDGFGCRARAAHNVQVCCDCVSVLGTKLNANRYDLVECINYSLFFDSAGDIGFRCSVRRSRDLPALFGELILGSRFSVVHAEANYSIFGCSSQTRCQRFSPLEEKV